MPRRVLVALAVFATAALVAAAAPAKPTKPALATKLAKALAVPHVRASQSGAVAFDLASGRTIFLRHPTLSLVPASVLGVRALQPAGSGLEVDHQGAVVGQVREHSIP